MDDPAHETAAEAHTLCPVSSSRLAWGMYDHERNRDSREGDVTASYSADRIASGEPVRKPFQYDGSLWICTSITGSGLTASGSTEHEAYRLLPERIFEGTPTTYGQTISTGESAEAARRSPNGFYHGIIVKCSGQTFVLCGPPRRFIPAQVAARPGAEPKSPAPEQLGLF